MYKARKERKRLLKVIQHEDAIAYAEESIKNTTNRQEILLHSYVKHMIEVDVGAESEGMGRIKIVRKEAKTFSFNNKIKFKEMRKIWKELIKEHKGEGIGLASLYFETAGRYIWLMR